MPRLGTRFDEQQTLLAGVLSGFFGGDLAGFERGWVEQVAFVADEDAGEVWVGVFADVCEPGAHVVETCGVTRWGGVGGEIEGDRGGSRAQHPISTCACAEGTP